MSKVTYAELVLQVDSVCFYELKSPRFMFGKSKYYWKYIDSMAYYGPFDSLKLASQHFEHSRRILPPLATTQLMEEPLLNNIIHVDFKNKRRIK